MNTIERIVSQDLCIGCGSCQSVCSHSAISSAYKGGMFLPLVDPSLCTNCGLCLKICPSNAVDVIKTYPDLDMGNVDYPSYTAWSRDAEIRKLGSSGGVISTMIIALLESKQYDKAYVLEYETFNGEKAILKPVFDREGVLKSVKSKYIPASVERVIEDIKTDTIGKAIIVATPCQLLAIKRYLELRKKTDEDLLYLGLFCDKTEKYSIYEHFEKKFGPYQALHFRDKEISGWPGNVLLKQGGISVDIPREERMAVKEQFQMNRCRYCFDMLNMLSDIAFGDCYEENMDDLLGRSSIVIRTQKGAKIFDQIKHFLYVLPTSFNAIKQSQTLDDKRVNLYFASFQSALYTNLPYEYSIVCDYIKILNGEKVTKYNKYMKVKRFLKKVFSAYTLPPVVLIDSVSFINKGAELMLCSIVAQIRILSPESIIVVHNHVYNQNAAYCVQNNIYPLYPPKSGLKKIRYEIAVNYLIRKPCFITPDKVDVILDAAGLHYSDHHIKPNMKNVCGKDSYTEYLNDYYAQFSKPNCKLILLPQMFGPFENKESIQAAKYAYSRADLIIARDQLSYNYLKSILHSTDKLLMYPDFTCLLHVDGQSKLSFPSKQYILIAPNSRMLDKTDKHIAETYKSFLITVLEFLLEKGENVYLLNHEGSDDERLLYELNTRLSKSLPVLTNLSAIEVKYLIANSKMLISSRFHGVVSGLSQGVPTFCTSWSHKYQELLKDYKCSKNLLDVLDVDNSLMILADALKSPSKYTPNKNCITHFETQTREMWKMIFDAINR